MDFFSDLDVDGKSVELYLKDMLCEVVQWIHLTQNKSSGACVNTAVKLRVPYKN
jgi:hypothetical protein